MPKKLMIEAIYGIESNINLEDSTIESYDKNALYYSLHGSFVYNNEEHVGFGELILTEDQLNIIMEGVGLKFNIVKNNIVYFHWDNEYAETIGKLKLKAEFLFMTRDDEDEIDIDDADPEDWNYFYFLTELKVPKSKTK